MIKLYNTETKKKEEFKPITKGKATVYTCGPTVYWHQHIGNLRSYIFADTLRRILEYNKYQVQHVINVTDVGHLTSDEDTGEDKIEQTAKKEGKKAQDIAQHYFNKFHEDCKKLRLKEPTTWAWATKHIKEQISMIQTLEKKGYTYKTKDGIYFDTSKFPDYGRLTRKKIEELQGGKRISLGEKKNKTDFALWKLSNKPGERLQEWNSPWGTGFPGWHIECSAMSTTYLGKNFDIHTGGEDHPPVHHENEIAQSECALNNKPWVHYWMHGAFLTIPGGKMSKSKGIIITLTELEKQGIKPLTYKYFTYSAHYRKPLTWSKEAINTAQQSFNKLKRTIQELADDKKKISEAYLQQFIERINDDLDMPGAIAVLWKLVKDEKATGKKETIKEFDKVLQLQLLTKEEVNIPKKIQELAEKREQARNNKEWDKSDKIRNEIKKLGWNIKDEKKGYTIEKV